MSAIIVLEGINGVGKTTYAQALASATRLPVYRAFRDNIGAHWGEKSERERLLKERFGVPLNTHVDDLYVADFLASFKAGAILDRSMPSAIAYGLEQGSLIVSDAQREMLQFWETSLISSGARVAYVWLKAPYDVAKARCEGRAWPMNKTVHNRLDKVFERVFQATRLPKRQINTGDIAAADGVKSILKMLEA